MRINFRLNRHQTSPIKILVSLTVTNVTAILYSFAVWLLVLHVSFTFQISLVFALFTSFRPALIFGIVDFGCSLDNSFDFQANL